MATPCHPLPPKPAGTTSDPYLALGLDHDATPAQIKVAYRKLALRYHPDRQVQSPPTVPGGGGDGGPSSAAVDAAAKEATDKFAEISAAYAVISDPVRKKEYDHLYKFGAFDGDDDDRIRGGGESGGASAPQAVPTNNNYQYTENYSGGYYKPGYKPPAQTNNRANFQQAAAAFQSMQSQDSFFDDLIYSPKSSSQKFDFEKNDNNDENKSAEAAAGAAPPQPNKKPGIGFSFKPVGKHLSVHVPSRCEIVSNMTRSDLPRGAHLFGARVTFSQQQTTGPSKLDKIATCGTDTTAACAGGGNEVLKEKKVVSTTTRIAKGQRRIVKRTAHLRPDGTKEVVIEENGVVRRRYVDESLKASINSNNDGEGDGDDARQNRDDSETSPKEQEEEPEEKEGGIQKEGKFTLMSLFKSCLAPCASIGDG